MAAGSAHVSFNTPVGALTLFEDDGSLVAVEFGYAPDGASTSLLDDTRSRLEAYFDGAPEAFDLPLNPAGTPFQRAVWTRMRAIPYGETITYGDIARAIGGASRAVGVACGRNPLPILIPCHRVVGAQGALGGYSAGDGVATKAALLRLEGALVL